MLVSKLLARPRKYALRVISVLVAMATVVAFAESYRALYTWALRHELTGIWAFAFPAQIDTFVLIGELTLFVGLVDRWHWRARVFPWVVALGGLAVSVAGNVGHVSGHDFFTRATASVAPLAATAGLMVGLGTLKRVVRLHHSTALPDLDAEVVQDEAIDPDDAQGSLDEPQEPLAAIRAREGASLSNGSTGTAEASTEPHRASHAAPRTRSWSRERRINHLVKANPRITGAELGRALGLSERQGQRELDRVRGGQLVQNSMGA